MSGDNVKLNAAVTYYSADTFTAGVNASKNICDFNLSLYAGGVTDGFKKEKTGFLCDLNATTPKFYKDENISLSSGARIRTNLRGEDSYIQFRGKLLNINVPLNQTFSAYGTLLADAKNNLTTGAWEYKASVYAGVEADFGWGKCFIEGQPSVKLGGESSGKCSMDVNAGIKLPFNPTK